LYSVGKTTKTAELLVVAIFHKLSHCWKSDNGAVCVCLFELLVSSWVPTKCTSGKP